METPHFRHSKYLYRAQIILCSLLLFCSLRGAAQNQNKPFYDYSRRIHFGFTIGSNFSRFKYDFSPYWYQQDTFLKVNSVGYPGFTLGPVINLHVGSTRSYLREHFDLRLIPSLVLSERRIRYTLNDNSEVEKKIEGAIVEFPLLAKFKSDRFQNLRFYVIAGGKYGYDLASEAKATKNPNDPRVAVRPSNINYEFGTGLDLYFPFFKFSPEVKVSRGINNLLVPDEGVYTKIFSRFRSNFIFFSLYFEG